MKVLHTFVVVFISVFMFLSCSTKNNPVYTLTTSTDPAASGIVTPSEGGFDEGSEVEITATANGNMVFSGWRGDYTGNENPTVITMNSDKNIMAFFVDRQYPLSIHIVGEGTVTERVLQEKSAEYAPGTFVELTAHPAEGWKLVEWRGDLSGSENPAGIRMDDAREVTAVFEKREYPLSISIEGEGSVAEQVIQEKSTDYENGTLVELTAHSADGWVFSGWDGDLEGNENPETIFIEKESGVTAIFKPVEEILALDVQGEGTVDIEQIETDDNPSKTRVQLTARPFDGWRFAEWQGGVTGSDNPVQITLNEKKAVNAVFEIREYPLTIHTEGEGNVAEQVVQQKTTDYEDGTVVELTANAAQGWEFIEWQGDLSGSENPKQITIDSPKEITAVFAEESEESTFNLAVNVDGEGTVSKNPDQPEYEPGTMVELTATPIDGWRFVKWTGGISSTQTSAEITMDSNKEVTAVFAEESEGSTFNLAVNVEGEGTVNKNPDQPEYEPRTMVELTATPTDGWEFVEWTGDINSSQTSVEITMDSNKEVTAVFTEESEEIAFNLDVNIQGEGSVSIDPEQDEYGSGTMVELTASPSDGWEFVEWTGDINSSQNSVEITMDSNKEVTAVFAEESEEIAFDLSVNIEGKGSVNIDPEQDEYEDGAMVELTASPSDGWEFVEWTGDINSAQTSVEITMDSDKEVTAVFAEEPEVITFNLAVNVDGDGSVNIDPEQDDGYEDGAMVELTATPSDGWEFLEWTGDVNSSQTSVEITMDADKEVTAVFEETLFDLTLNITGNGTVNISPDLTEFEPGTFVELTAEPSDGWEFDQWEGDLTGTENPASITMVSSAEITAVFIEQETTFSGGDGSSGNPYQVSTAEQLQAISEFLNSHFIQINNINAGSTSGWNGGQGFSPIGSSSNPFTGTFNGNGFEISGLTIDRDDDEDVGLFGFTGNAQINNVGLVNVNIVGEENVGGLAGTNNGRISNSYVTGNISGDELVGGLVGANRNNARIVNSYSTGSVSGDEEVGGFVGRNWPNGVIATSYASGRVSGDDDTGGFIGRNQASLDSCYWDNQATNQSNGIGDGTQNGLTGLTTSEMTGSSAENNMPGFDWNRVWRTSGNYPVHQ